jgi:hypothetical protein
MNIMHNLFIIRSRLIAARYTEFNGFDITATATTDSNEYENIVIAADETADGGSYDYVKKVEHAHDNQERQVVTVGTTDKLNCDLQSLIGQRLRRLRLLNNKTINSISEVCKCRPLFY